jgi:hypothetical protein
VRPATGRRPARGGPRPERATAGGRRALQAAHRVLGRHQHAPAVGRREQAVRHRCVVVEGMRDDLEAVALEKAEEALGMPDAGHGMHGSVAERLQRAPLGAVEAHRLRARQRHPQAPGGAAAARAVADHEVDLVEACGRLAQRAGGQAAAVADAALRVDHRDLEVPLQAVMLQPVVRHDDVCAGGHGGAGRREPVPADPHRHAGDARQQQGLIAAEIRRVPGRHAVRLARLGPAIAAADDRGAQAAPRQRAHQPGHQRRLAGAAHGHVADHHHRAARMGRCAPAARVGEPSQANHCPVGGLDEPRPQRRRHAVVPCGQQSSGACIHGFTHEHNAR